MAITPDIQQQVYDLLSRASNVSFVTADQAAGSGSILTPGQRVSAEVLAMFPNNRVQVRVGSERYNLELPMAVRPGQTLDMTFVGSDPRSTFAISRQAGMAPPVSLSDASRLVSLLVSNEQIVDPNFRSSLQSIGDLLRRSSGETGVLANLMDEALTYGTMRDGVKATPPAPGDFGDNQGTRFRQGGQLAQDQVRLAAFEKSAAQILRGIAENSRFILLEAANQPVTALPLTPGDEVDAAVLGTLPGGRVFLQIAGSAVEMTLPRVVQSGDIIRLTYIAGQPKLTFALPRAVPDISPGLLSEAGRWLSILEHSEGGISPQQSYVLERLNAVLRNLPADSPALSAFLDDTLVYRPNGTIRDATAQMLQQGGQGGSAPVGNGLQLSDDMAKLLQAVISGNRLALLESLSQAGQPSGFAPGQQIRGEVLAGLGGGRFLVEVAGQNLEFLMPRGTRRGDRPTLFFISDEPLQTFLMIRSGRSGDARVSETGRWLSGFLSESSARTPASETLSLLRPLLSGPAADAPHLGRLLQQGLRESGLFYEAHLARWFAGEYALEEILKEPQGKLSPRLSSGGGDAGGDTGRGGGVDQRLMPLLDEQLTVLQQGHVTLRGDLLPGSALEWSVTGRDSGRNSDGSRERSWESGIDVTLPRLGRVAVQLSLDGTAVSVYIRAVEQSTVPILQQGAARLAEQLEGAGLVPAEIRCAHDNPRE